MSSNGNDWIICRDCCGAWPAGSPESACECANVNEHTFRVTPVGEGDAELRKAAQRALDVLDAALADEVAPEAVGATAEAALDLSAALAQRQRSET